MNLTAEFEYKKFYSAFKRFVLLFITLKKEKQLRIHYLIFTILYSFYSSYTSYSEIIQLSGS